MPFAGRGKPLWRHARVSARLARTQGHTPSWNTIEEALARQRRRNTYSTSGYGRLMLPHQSTKPDECFLMNAPDAQWREASLEEPTNSLRATLPLTDQSYPCVVA